MRSILWVLLVTLLSGCGLIQPQPTAVPDSTTVAEIEPEPTVPAATALPTNTVTVEVTVTPEATQTAEPTSTAVPTATPQPTMTTEGRIELFNDVWQIVNEHYLYSDFNGTDWAATRDIYQPKIQAAQSDQDVYTILIEMIDSLGDRHSRFAAPEEARSEDALASGTDTYVGIGVLTNVEEEYALVTLVFADSPAQEAGLQRGDRIIAVDGEPFSSTEAIRGPEGSQLTLTIQRPQTQPRDITLTRRAVQGRIIPSSQRLPNAESIGYLYIPSLWADSMDTDVISELQTLREGTPALDGLIIDLRGNGGGWRTVLEGILSQFVDGNVGEFFSQTTAYELAIKDGIEKDFYQALPLVVFVDVNSASYAEILAGTLQYNGATIIGTPSQGNTETIFQYNFDNGSRLWVAQEGFRLPNGTNFEGQGVQPDYVIDDDWTQYSLPNDPAVLAAIAVLEEAAGR